MTLVRSQARLLQAAGALTAIAVVGTLSGSVSAAEPAAPFLSEIHYANNGTDTGEALEIEAPAGFDLSGWRLSLSNGDTRALAGAVPEAGVVVASFPTDGLPDTVALVNPNGTVADQLMRANLGVSESDSTRVGYSLQKIDGTWHAPAPHTFGIRNGTQEPAPNEEPVACDLPVDRTIAEVQGTGATSPLAGSRVTIEGVVTADHRTGGYNGIYVQTAGTGDRSPAAGVASDGVFIFLTSNTANHPDVTTGDQVRVRGVVSEFNGLTELTIGARADVQVCAHDAPLPASAPLTLPLDPAARESVESMLVAPIGTHTVSDVFNTNRFGEVVLAAADEPEWKPTDRFRPGTQEAKDLAAGNKLRRILLDDGLTTNLTNANLQPPYLAPDAPLRVGDTVEAFGPTVLSFGFNEWRLQPATPVRADTLPPARTAFKVTNPRTEAPEAVGGDIKVASFNVLNYFVHFGGDARGADDEEGLGRQQAKIVSAATALDADVVALEEIENSLRFENNDPQLALEHLVAALNAVAGAGTWDYVRSPANLPPAAQQDFITAAIIFKPGAVTPKGESRTINDETVWFNAREPIAQTFTSGSATFTVVANHFKSKSGTGTGDNADSGDLQGSFNGDRVRQARSLVSFVETLKTDSGSDDVLLMGDFNSYGQEDPLRVLTDASYVNVDDTGKASYVFAGESGSLDHAFASPSLAGRVTGVDVWQINSHESFAFEYDGVPSFYAPNPYRASDHNPLVIGLDTGPIELQLLGINDFHGRLESPGGGAGGAAQLAGLVNQLREQNRDTLFLSAGDNIGASTFISAIDQDNPTPDALNLMGLDAAAVGNHEFDKGMADLTDRVIPRAEFPYLGANVYRGDERALPAFDVRTVGGVRVGIVGVVTEQTASLVSPDGIAGITFRDPVDEAENVAAELKDGNEANGEADVVVLLTHEGAATENIGSIADLERDPVFGEFMRASADIDAILSGHTHQPYAFAAPIPGTDRTRPVLQAQEYGRKLGKATLSIDPATKSIVDTSATLLDVVGAPADPAVADLVARAKANADVLGQRPLGSITADIERAVTPGGTEDRGSESVLGNFIADVQLTGSAAPGRGDADIALMNPGGLRADLQVGTDGVITFAEAFAVQPFANDVVTMTLTGAQLKQVLEEQWQPPGASRPKLHLGVSKGFGYTYLPDNAQGSRITSMTLNGAAVSPTTSYRVTVNSFLAAGGDNFATLAAGTNRTTTGDNDLTMLVDYFAANSPVTADPASRATVGAGCTRTVTGRHTGPLTVDSGLLCLNNATVTGPVTVRQGAGLIANGGRITGPVSVTGARNPVRLDGVRITGPVAISNNTGGVVVAGNSITGPLACSGNNPPPGNENRPNTVHGPKSGQCARL